MQFFESGKATNSRLRGWSTTQTADSGGSVERFGTSWLYDVMVAAGQNAAGLRGANPLRLTGSVDANHGATPLMHASHDLGMSFDLGISEYISDDIPRTSTQPLRKGNQTNANEVRNVAASAVGWSVANARTQMAPANGVVETDQYRLPVPANSPPGALGENLGRNLQSSALGAFMSLYSVTRDDGTVAGSRGALTFVNGVNDADARAIREALFGTGGAGDGMVAGVLVGGKTTTENPLRNIHQVLSNLGFTDNVQTSTTTPTLNTEYGHQNHFHIYLRPPTARPLEPHALHTTSISVDSETTDTETQQSVIQDPETTTMLPDMPPLPPNDLPAIVMQMAATGKAVVQKAPENCYVVWNEKPAPGFNDFNPVSFKIAKQLGFSSPQMGAPFGFYEVDVLVPPNHGRVVAVGGDTVQSSYPQWSYEANDENYLGWDQATFLIKAKGQEFRSTVTFRVVQNMPQDREEFQTLYRKLCSYDKSVRTSGATTWPDYQSNYPTEVSQWFQGALVSSVLSMMSGVTYSFSDLSGSSVGQTTGEGVNASITLDSNAAGHGWYIDPTPLDNTDDFLPTSNPNVWQAKAGSEAAGKMDMLSVLLHEYGHALGLEHAADSADFMSATLQPGQRRLPSADELTLMSQLVAQLKASTAVADGSAPQAPDAPSAPLNPSAPLGALLIGRLALGRKPEDEGTNALGTSQALSQALFSANPTLQGGNLSTLQDWATQGNVVTDPANTGNASTPAGATLAESTTSQTRLNQVFMVGPQDRYLSFTLSNLALDDAANGPDDAFEAALINANTGADLLAPLALSHTDALLNLQAGGAHGLAELAAQGVTHVTHADGSRTYLVDLSGIARDADGTVAVNLSFDLIGFGNTATTMGSHVQVSDVRLLGLPQAADDSVSTAEDSTLSFNALANDTDAVQTGFAPIVIAGPAHGSVSVNADGSFSYTPDANYFGADSFSYHISNGSLASNTATVSLTITPVNDAPVAADVTVSTAEDTPVAIQLIASDLDSTGASLQFTLQAQPQHGSLVQGAIRA